MLMIVFFYCLKILEFTYKIVFLRKFKLDGK